MVQWKPNADLEIYAEGLWSGYRGTQANDFYGQTLRGGTLSNVVLFDGEAPKAASLTHSGGGSPDIWRLWPSGELVPWAPGTTAPVAAPPAK